MPFNRGPTDSKEQAFRAWSSGYWAKYPSRDPVLLLGCQTWSTWSEPLQFHRQWFVPRARTIEHWLVSLTTTPFPAFRRWLRRESTALEPTSLTPPRSTNGVLETEGIGFRLPRALHVSMVGGDCGCRRCSSVHGFGPASSSRWSRSCFAIWGHSLRRASSRCCPRRRCAWSPSCFHWLSRRWPRARGRRTGGGPCGRHVDSCSACFVKIFRSRWCHIMLFRRPDHLSISRAFAGDGASMAAC